MEDQDERYRPIGEVLDGLRVPPLPEGWTPIDAVNMVKCLDEDGEVRWSVRATQGMSMEEVLGALISRTDLLRKDLLAEYDADG